ncbi:MAG: single-stranded-DNA-specific exonuclease RecJ [Tissierellia bacterium]|nr:single-stranded-DNA-specific exonuclease RecJ [Tissierellia bacterium]
MKEKWFIRNKTPEKPINYQSLGINNLIYKILINRGIDSQEALEEFLDPSPKRFHSPILMKDILKAGNLLSSLRKNQGKLRIIGDYDADGTMATTILMKGLGQLGFNVDYYIPHRIHDGYGLNKDHVLKAKEDQVDLIITCDNGIAAFEAVELARQHGIRVLITDHHNIPKEEDDQGEKRDRVPQADGVINPKQVACSYPFKDLSGAAVAYKLVVYLYTIMGHLEDLDPSLLAYAAIATICDVMPLKGENRTLVTLGLKRLNQLKIPAVEAIKEASSLRGDIRSGDIGFVIGPTINSAGRLSDANQVVELFLCEDYTRALDMAKDLRQLNYERQKLTTQGLEKIEEALKRPGEKDLPIYLLRHDDLHESIAGIIAGRIKEKYHRPTIVLTKGKDLLKGSGRSIEAWNMVEEIGKSKKFLQSFGGHAMACGLSLREEDFPSFKRHLLDHATLKKEDLVPIYRIDQALDLSQTSLDLAQSLSDLGPFGSGNPQPSFGALNLGLLKAQILGKNRNVLKIFLTERREVYEAIYFGDSQAFCQELVKAYGQEALESVFKGRPSPVQMDIIYSLEENEFRGKLSLQIKIISYRFTKVW